MAIILHKKVLQSHISENMAVYIYPQKTGSGTKNLRWWKLDNFTKEVFEQKELTKLSIAVYKK